MTDEKDLLTNCYTKLYYGMVRKDLALLREILADDFVLVHMTGMKQSKDEFIYHIASGQLQYFSADTEQIIIKEIKDNRASLLGKSQVEAAVFGGGRHLWKLQLELTFCRQNGLWYIAKALASVY